LDIVQKICAPLTNFFAPSGVPSLLRACPYREIHVIEHYLWSCFRNSKMDCTLFTWFSAQKIWYKGCSYQQTGHNYWERM